MLNLMCYFLIETNLHVGFIENGQIYHAIEKSRKILDSSNTILLGGSVANQMYYSEEYNGSINSCCTVMPITMAGQYLILKNIIRHNDLKGKDVVLIMHPNGFTARLHGASLYHYFMKPFYNNEFIPLMDSLMLETLSGISNRYIYQLPVVRCTNWVPNKEQLDLEKANASLAPLSVHYLKAIDSLAETHKFRFRVIAPIQPEKNKQLSYQKLKEEIGLNGLKHIFKDYFDDLKYFRDNFFEDGFHVKDRNIIPYNVLNL